MQPYLIARLFGETSYIEDSRAHTTTNLHELKTALDTGSGGWMRAPIDSVGTESLTQVDQGRKELNYVLHKNVRHEP